MRVCNGEVVSIEFAGVTHLRQVVNVRVIVGSEPHVAHVLVEVGRQRIVAKFLCIHLPNGDRFGLVPETKHELERRALEAWRDALTRARGDLDWTWAGGAPGFA